MPDQKPLITISIPTYNSARYLERCLKAVTDQTYTNFELNVVDGGSQDGTLQLARQLGVTEDKLLTYSGALLGARREGVKIAKGDYILLLDSDQILDPDALEKCMKKISEGFDMLFLEEGVYKLESTLEKLIAMDKKLLHTVKDFSPITGALLPRFYKTSILKKAFEEIPPEYLEQIGGHDHAIIYYEAQKISQKVALVDLCVRHIESDSIKLMMKKFYRWGLTSSNVDYGKYSELMGFKKGLRKGLFSKGLVKESLEVLLLIGLRGLPGKLGIYMGKFKRLTKK